MAKAARAKSKETQEVRYDHEDPARQAPARKAHPVLEFSDYSLPDLVEMKMEVERAIKAKQEEHVATIRAKVAETANIFGLSIHELMGITSGGRRVTKHARGPQPAKYRGPNGEEWSGRGPSPRWMKPFLAEGKTKEDFLIE